MECKNCELQQRQFFCTDCICAHTRDFRMTMEHSITDRDEQVVKSTTALRSVETSRALRVDVTQAQTRVDELLNALTRLRKDAEDKRGRLGRLREALAQRRHTLAAATSATLLTPSAIPASASHPALAAPLASVTNLPSLITAARVGLIQELVVVFNVAEVGRRPPLGGNAGSQGDWSIGDLILPVPGDVRRYPPQHINAVLSHTVHFLGLLSFYLGVKLPFTIRWDGGKLGVGIPWIEPGVGGWGKWTASYPLHLSLSSTPTPAPSPVTPQSSPYSSPSTDLSLSQFLSPTKRDILNPLQPQPPPTPESDHTHFTTAFAMILYDVLYIAHTQGLAISLAQAGDVLSNLWAVCCAPELGRRSHSCAGYPHTRLPAPGSSGFGVDFAHVLQATASVGRSRAGLLRHVGANVMSERWEGAEQIREGRGGEKRNREPKQEDEDGWDLVSEDGN
ncbi:UV radiation resistance protein and autophagy-related subunit 14-domain-containing protein [Mycena leptocephala]|nr:UV radiation resistance protein and autophagy-related subunit 14-domain-containing protein [Mycena leptocephala]